MRQTRSRIQNACTFRWSLATVLSTSAAARRCLHWSGANCGRVRCTACCRPHEQGTRAARGHEGDARIAEVAKGAFDSVSHELKTPLAAMTAALRQPRPNSAELQRDASHTVDNLLDATRLESGLHSADGDPGELVHEDMAASGLKEGDVQINIRYLPAVSVD